MPERISETFKVTRFESYESITNIRENGDIESDLEYNFIEGTWNPKLTDRWDKTGRSVFHCLFYTDQPLTVEVNGIPKTENVDYESFRNSASNEMVINFKSRLMAGDTVRISKPE